MSTIPPPTASKPPTPFLRVAHVALGVNRFLPGGNKPGLPDIVPKLPPLEVQLGVQSSLVLPFHGQTRALIQRNHLGKLAKLYTLPYGSDLGKKQAPTSVYSLQDGLGYPIYFIRNEHHLSRPPELSRDPISTLAFFARAALAVLRRQGCPQIIHCHGWETVPLLIYLRYEKDFCLAPQFAAVKTMLSLYDTSDHWHFTPEKIRQLHLGLEYHRPVSWLGEERSFNLLSAGLALADLVCSPGYSFVQRLIAGEIDPASAPFAQAKHQERTLVGFFEDDSRLYPNQELPRKTAADLALHQLGAYRVLVRDFFGMTRALSTLPPQEFDPVYLEQRLDRALRDLGVDPAELSPSDHEVLVSLFRDQQESRLAAHSFDDLDLFLTFLKIEPDPRCLFEAQLRNTNLVDFVRSFNLHKHDIDRIFSLEIDLSECRNPKLLNLYPDRRSLTLYEALDKLGVVSHLIRICRMLQMINGVCHQKREARDEVIRAYNLGFSARDLQTHSMQLEDIMREAGLPFILTIMLHDIGKVIHQPTHGRCGAEMLDWPEFYVPLRALLTVETETQVKRLVRHHMCLGLYLEKAHGSTAGIVAWWEELKAACLNDPMALRREIDMLTLFSLTDAWARTETYQRAEQKLLVALSAILAEATDPTDLEEKLNSEGFSAYGQGKRRWEDWTRLPNQADQSKDEKQRLKKEAGSELAAFLAAHKQTGEREFYVQLSSFDIVYPNRLFYTYIPEIRHRARLLFWLYRLSLDSPFREIKFVFSSGDNRPAEIKQLNKLLADNDHYQEFCRLIVRPAAEPGKMEINLIAGGEK